MKFEEIHVGQSASRTVTVDGDLVSRFSEVSGDTNPVHLDEGYAKQTIFQGRIAHGMLSGALISAVLANDLPGNGTIYLSQSFRFLKPVRLGDSLTATVTVTSLDQKKRFIELTTECFVQDGSKVVSGVALTKLL